MHVTDLNDGYCQAAIPVVKDGRHVTEKWGLNKYIYIYIHTNIYVGFAPS